LPLLRNKAFHAPLGLNLKATVSAGGFFTLCGEAMAVRMEDQLAEVTVSQSSNKVALRRSDAVSKSGTHYFDFFCEPDRSPSSSIRIWSNELFDFAKCLDRVLSLGLDEISLPNGTYPLECSLSASGGLGFFLNVNQDDVNLVVRRLVPSFSNKKGKTAYTRYMQWSRFRRYMVQAQLPANEETRDLLTSFATSLQSLLFRFLEPLAEDLGLKLSDEPLFNDFVQRLTLAGQLGNKRRKMPFDIGVSNLEEMEVAQTEKSLVETILTHCSAARSPNELGTLSDFALDDIAIKRLLSWDQRYNVEVLKAGFIAVPYSTTDGSNTLLAVRDKSLFAADPLLSALVPLESNKIFGAVDSGQDWLRLPQFKSPPYEAALEKGFAKGPYGCGLGKTVMPHPSKCDALQKVFGPNSAMKMNRWRILQLLDLQTCQVANQAATIKYGFEESTVGHLQQLAVLINDVSGLFDSEVEEFLSAATSVYADAIAGKAIPRKMFQPSELPKD
jgi:hypothetical protein